MISKAEGKKAATHSGNYQDSITTPLAHEHDNNATGDDEDNEPESAVDLDSDTNTADSVLSAIKRVASENCQGCLFKPLTPSIIGL